MSWPSAYEIFEVNISAWPLDRYFAVKSCAMKQKGLRPVPSKSAPARKESKFDVEVLQNSVDWSTFVAFS